MSNPNTLRDATMARMARASERPFRPGSPKWDNRGDYQPATTVFAPRSTDDEASALLDELSKLQTLMVMNMSRGPEWIAAADLVQRTRILIIERCKRPTQIAPTPPAATERLEDGR